MQGGNDSFKTARQEQEEGQSKEEEGRYNDTGVIIAALSPYNEYSHVGKCAGGLPDS